MSIVKNVLKDENDRLEKLSIKYQENISKCPQGSLSKRVKNGNEYIYLVKRESKKVVFKYVGKANSDQVKNVMNRINQRKVYESKLKKVKGDLREIKRAVNGKIR